MTVNKEARAEESLLSRWSRRKLEADSDDAASAPAVEPMPEPNRQTLPGHLRRSLAGAGQKRR